MRVHPVIPFTLALIVTGAGTLPAQAIVLPPRAEQRPGAFISGALHGSSYDNEARTQVLFDANDLPATPTTIRSLSVRPCANSFVWRQATTFQMTITLSAAPVAPGAASANFAANRGSNAVQVFSGPVSFPEHLSTGPWPVQWYPPITFTTPFTFQRADGASLLLEFEVSGSTSQRSRFIEGYGFEGGSSEFEHHAPNCQHSGGWAANGFGWQGNNLYPGSPYWSVSIGSFPTNTPSLHFNTLMFGTVGSGGSYGGLTLPFPLQAIGLPAGPACEWSIDSFTQIPMTYHPAVGQFTMSPAIPIPSDPGLVNAVFFTQNLAVDTVAGMPSFYPSFAIRWTIGSGTSPAASTVQRRGNNANPIGIVSMGRAMAVRLN